MKNVRVKVREDCTGTSGTWWGFAVYEGKKLLLHPPDDSRGNKYMYKANAIRNAKAMAKRISIKYDPEIVKQKGC